MAFFSDAEDGDDSPTEEPSPDYTRLRNREYSDVFDPIPESSVKSPYIEIKCVARTAYKLVSCDPQVSSASLYPLNSAMELWIQLFYDMTHSTRSLIFRTDDTHVPRQNYSCAQSTHGRYSIC